MRAANVERDGKAMSCLLLSYSIPPNPAPRSWVEREYCIDPATGLLQMWSEAPGIYALYDYNGAANFHGHTLPRQISIFEDGRLAVQVRVESLEDAPNLDPNLFKPTPEMMDAGESFKLAAPRRFPVRVDPSDAPTSPFFQPVIVHAILDAQDGSVLDAEALQNSDRDLSRAAIDLVRSNSFQPSGFQQEAFINVQFHMPAATLGRPADIPLSVRWINLGSPRQSSPGKKAAAPRELEPSSTVPTCAIASVAVRAAAARIRVMAFPANRMRRLRRTETLRTLVRETRLTPESFVYPLFICPGTGIRKEVRSMPGVFNLSVDEAVKEVRETRALGVSVDHFVRAAREKR